MCRLSRLANEYVGQWMGGYVTVPLTFSAEYYDSVCVWGGGGECVYVRACVCVCVLRNERTE